MNASVTEPTRAEPTLRKMTGTIGAEMIGVRLAEADEATVERVRDAVLAHKVVAVRGQFLEPEQQIAFGRRLGSFMTVRGLKANTQWPELFRVASSGKATTGTEMWHTDGVTMEQPPSYTILAAQALPDAGGDTLFANMGYAYRTLSPVYRRLLRGMRARHKPQQMVTDKAWETWHPLVRTIPETGERVLYPGVSYIVVDIEGMTVAESRSLLDFLFAHAIRPDGMYRHRWQPGDVVVWDNRTTMHYAVHDYGDEPRVMMRLMIEGERPFEAPYGDEED
jgi:taurine dioxygenase